MSADETAEDELLGTAMDAVENFLEYLQDDDVDALSAVIIIAEIIGTDGRPYLVRFSDDMSGPWKHDGMMRYSADMTKATFLDQFAEVPVRFDDEEDE